MCIRTEEGEVFESKQCVLHHSWKANHSCHKDGCGGDGSSSVSPNRRHSSWSPHGEQRLHDCFSSPGFLGGFLLDDVSVCLLPVRLFPSFTSACCPPKKHIHLRIAWLFRSFFLQNTEPSPQVPQYSFKKIYFQSFKTRT